MASTESEEASRPVVFGSDGGDRSVFRQYDLGDVEFNELRALIRDLTGIKLSDSKRQMVYRRVSSRLRALDIGSFKEYCRYLRTGDEAELEKFCNVVTTNLTSFFRESHHFDYLATKILPEIIERKESGVRRLRIWSAGCSTGEEPYSIAITLKDAMPELHRWDARILATDLDSNVVAAGRAGVFAFKRVEELSSATLKRWFLTGRDENEQVVKVRHELQELITFKELNLMHDWPMRGLFDVIFCRNVIIYFDKAIQKVLIQRYAQILEEGGYLVLGHSESLFNVSARFDLLGKTVYRKIR